MAGVQLKPSLKTAHQHWKGFDLDSRRPILDQTILQAKEKHKESLSKRKQLAEITKKFRKAAKLASESATAVSPDDASVASVIGDVSKEGKNTVKAYQEESESEVSSYNVKPIPCYSCYSDVSILLTHIERLICGNEI